MKINTSFPSYSVKSPAFVIFMIDQSASMMNVSLGGGDRAEIAAQNIQNAIIDILNKCISGVDIKPRAYISVIGYGGQFDTAEIIREGWVNEWAEDIEKATKNKECIIPIIADGMASMNEGFGLANDLCNNWILARKDADDMGPIIVINLTKGTTIDMEDTYKYTKEIMSQKAILYNVIIPAEIDEGEDVFFPNFNPFEKDSSRNWIFDVSSVLPGTIVEMAKIRGFTNLSNESRGLIISSSCSSAVSICGISLIAGKSAFDNSIIR